MNVFFQPLKQNIFVPTKDKNKDQKQVRLFFVKIVKTDVVQNFKLLPFDTRQVVKKACQVNADAKKFPRTKVGRGGILVDLCCLESVEVKLWSFLSWFGVFLVAGWDLLKLRVFNQALKYPDPSSP